MAALAHDTGKNADSWLVAFGVELKTRSTPPIEQTRTRRGFSRDIRGPVPVTIPGPRIVRDLLPAGPDIGKDIMIAEAEQVNTPFGQDDLLGQVPLSGDAGIVEEPVNLHGQKMPGEEEVNLPSTQYRALTRV